MCMINVVMHYFLSFCPWQCICSTEFKSRWESRWVEKDNKEKNWTKVWFCINFVAPNLQLLLLLDEMTFRWLRQHYQLTGHSSHKQGTMGKWAEGPLMNKMNGLLLLTLTADRRKNLLVSIWTQTQIWSPVCTITTGSMNGWADCWAGSGHSSK